MGKHLAGHLVRFLAVWLLGSVILGVVIGWAAGIGIGLVIAVGYLLATHHGALQLRSRVNTISNSAALKISSRE